MTKVSNFMLQGHELYSSKRPNELLKIKQKGLNIMFENTIGTDNISRKQKPHLKISQLSKINFTPIFNVYN